MVLTFPYMNTRDMVDELIYVLQGSVGPYTIPKLNLNSNCNTDDIMINVPKHHFKFNLYFHHLYPHPHQQRHN